MSNSKIDKGEIKRRKVTQLVRQSLGKKGWLTFKNLEWDTQLFDGNLSCGYLMLRRDGNVISFYTPTRETGHLGFPSFSSIEISLFNEKYESLAYRICSSLSRKRYAVGMTKDYCNRTDALPFEDFYKGKIIQ